MDLVRRRVKSNVLGQARIMFGMAIGLIVVGTIGYMFIEDLSLLDAVYMTIITITTVGFREVRPLDAAGKLFTVLLITGGVGTWVYAFSSILRLLVEGQLKSYFTQRRMERMIGNIDKHIVVCGFGRIGSMVCRELAHEKIPFVVIEKKPSCFEQLRELDYLYIGGDATAEETLVDAGIANARGLISVLATDAGNVYTVLTARHLNSDLYIVCRSEDEASEDKILKAGANKVISPYRIGSHSLANAATRPHVVDFVEIVTTNKEMELGLDEFPITAESPLAGLTLVESKIRERFGIIVVACRSVDGTMIFNPPANHTICEGDVLIILGQPKHLANLDRNRDGGAL